MIKEDTASDLKIKRNIKNSVIALIVFSVSISIFFSVVAFVEYEEASPVQFALETILLGSVSGLIATGLFLKKKYNLAKFLLIVVPPYSLVIAGVLITSGGNNQDVYFYLMPKFFAIVYLLGPIVFFGLRRVKYMFISFIIVLPTVLFYDYFNRINGVFIDLLEVNHENYYLFVSVVSIFIGFTLIITLNHEMTGKSFKFKIDNQKDKIRREYVKVKELNADLRYESYLYKILNITSKSSHLSIVLEEVLDELLSINTFSIKQKGIIFLTNDEGDLEVSAQRNVEPALTECTLINNGEYLYGEVVEAKRNTLYEYKSNIVEEANKVDANSNYIIPILDDDDVLGMLSIYMEEDHVRDEKTEAFLETVARVLAKKIVADKTEKALKAKNIELDFNKREIEKTNLILKQTYKELDESINYAEYLQKSLVPNKETLDNIFEESSVFFSPKDRVSGDFYFAHEVGDNLFFGVADCTGHGIPGSFLAAMATEAVRSTIISDITEKPDVILNKLRDVAKKRFSINKGDTRMDSMDAALCKYDKLENKLYFSGGFSDLIIVRNGSELIEIKGTKCPIGSYPIEPDFELHQFELEKGDVIYLSTDGYVDQFGRMDGKEKTIKFKRKRFRELLVEISSLDCETQVVELERRFNEWRGNVEQIDDVTIFVAKHH